VAETAVKRLLCCGFRHPGKAMGRVYQCWWRICREVNVFFKVRISHVLHFISICDLFTDSLRYAWQLQSEYLKEEGNLGDLGVDGRIILK
jgi:hypothetical protein